MQSKISEENRENLYLKYVNVFVSFSLSKIIGHFQIQSLSPPNKLSKQEKQKAKFAILKMTQLVDSLPVLSNSIPEYGWICTTPPISNKTIIQKVFFLPANKIDENEHKPGTLEILYFNRGFSVVDRMEIV